MPPLSAVQKRDTPVSGMASKPEFARGASNYGKALVPQEEMIRFGGAFLLV
jgi:hypothetical protein